MGIRRIYDHRIRDAVVASGDPELFPQLNIPRSTVRSWLKEGPGDVVRVDDDALQLRVGVAHLEKQLAVLREVVRLLLALKRTGGAELERRRLISSEKQRLLAAIRTARIRMPVRSALAIPLPPTRPITPGSTVRCAASSMTGRAVLAGVPDDSLSTRFGRWATWFSRWRTDTCPSAPWPYTHSEPVRSSPIRSPGVV